MSRIPITGSIGAVYTLQFVIWALVTPQIGLFYAILSGGGLLLLPVAFYVNRASRRQAAVLLWAALSGWCAVLLLSQQRYPERCRPRACSECRCWLGLSLRGS